MTKPLLKALHVSSFDFDGCLLQDTDVLSLDQIKETNKVLLEAIRRQNKQFRFNIGYSGSNRQDAEIDDLNRNHDRVGIPPNRRDDLRSAFLTIPPLVEQTGASYDPMLMADVFAKQEQGEALRLALIEEPDTYHQNYVFDDSKLSLLYMQLHQSALNARGCDFIVINTLGDKQIKDVPKRSNAAYIYNKAESKLYYVNSIEGIQTHGNVTLQQIQFLIEGLDGQEPDNVYKRAFNQQIIEGFSLSAEQFTQIANQFQHRHKTQDYPVVFDFYDDRQDILSGLNDFFSANPELLPRNVILRLHRYDAQSRNNLNLCFASIKGTGKMNPNPGDSLNTIIEDQLGYEADNHEGFHFGRGEENQNALKTAIESQAGVATLKESANLEPNFMIDNDIANLAKVESFSPTKLQTDLRRYLNQRQQKGSKNDAEFSIREQRAAIEEFIDCIEGRRMSIGHECVPVLQQGEIGNLITSHGHAPSTLIDNVYTNDAIPAELKNPINMLLNYKLKRQERSPAAQILDMGISKFDKFAAVNALIDALIKNRTNPVVDITHQKALENGQLSQLLQRLSIKPQYSSKKKLLDCLSSNVLNLNTKTDKRNQVRAILNSNMNVNHQALALLATFMVPAKVVCNQAEFGQTSSFNALCKLVLKPGGLPNNLRDALLALSNLNDEAKQAIRNARPQTWSLSRPHHISVDQIKRAFIANKAAIAQAAQALPIAIDIYHEGWAIDAADNAITNTAVSNA